jgi:gliding motility-associated protein GldC
MKNSEIKFTVLLDDKNIPEKITWVATDGPSNEPKTTDAIALSLWDHEQLNTMQINLWTKEMPVLEMKRFSIEAIGGMADAIENATNDTVMAAKIRALCKDLVQHVKAEEAKTKM